MSDTQLRVSTPGRVCLFGEHQDYLHLPVIPCAISLRVAMTARPIAEQAVILDLPDIDGREAFPLDTDLAYRSPRDYFRAAVNVARRQGFTFSRGIHATVRSTIPINSGTSSSSALIVTWIDVLARFSDQHRGLAPHDLARLAHLTEVVEFGEPGGMMDHYATACGGVLAIEFSPALRVQPIDVDLGTFVLGDSGEPKDTHGILARVKSRVLAIADRLSGIVSGFSLQTFAGDDVDRLAGRLTRDELDLLRGTIRNRDITREAYRHLTTSPLDRRRIGALLTEHQTVLRDVLQISTPRIDEMLEAALSAGAYGGKINGSGGGGAMFAYAPENPEGVARAIERAGGRSYVVSPDEGTRLEIGRPTP